MSSGNLFAGAALSIALLSATLVPTSARAAAQDPAAPAKSAASPFPPGPGRDALFKACKECHGPESVLGQLKTRSEWSKTLDEMAANGATATDEEWTAILDYLDTYYSLIMVNTAPAKELAAKLDVPAEVAASIVSVREKAKIASIEELKKVPGIDAAKLDTRKDRLIF
jgi:competence protein ComEA